MQPQLNRTTHPATKRPLKVIQFGGGNFLRGFCDAMIMQLNRRGDFNGNVAVVEYMGSELANTINQQQGLYQLVLQGLVAGTATRETELIDCISLAINPAQDFVKYLALAAEPEVRYIISNTTEAGIVFDESDDSLIKPGKTFPAKLTQLLFARYQIYNGAKDKGFILLPCELIEDNGVALREICNRYAQLWRLESGFIQWLNNANHFCSTLVDRIVTGFPRGDQALLAGLPYEDRLVVVAEPYSAWVISGAEAIKAELIFNQSSLNVKLVEYLAPYRQLKVRLLNAVHTALVPLAYLLGINEVRVATEDPLLNRYLQQLIEREIIPTLAVSEKEAQNFAAEVIERFANPYIVHLLMSIALNSIAKFVARDLPIIKDYWSKYSQIPPRLALALAALLVFYRGKRGDELIELNDNPLILQFCAKIWQDESLTVDEKIYQLLESDLLWGENLAANSVLLDSVSGYVRVIIEDGVAAALKGILS